MRKHIHDIDSPDFIQEAQRSTRIIQKIRETYGARKYDVREYPADTDVIKTSSGRLKKVTTSYDQTRRLQDVWQMTSDLRRLEDV